VAVTKDETQPDDKLRGDYAYTCPAENLKVEDGARSQEVTRAVSSIFGDISGPYLLQ
jgi:hypothetical protein